MKKIMFLILALMLLTNVASEASCATLTTEIAAVRAELYQTDSSNSIFSDAQITSGINQGQEMLANLLSASSNYENCLTASASYITGAVTLTSPTYFKKIVEVFDSTGKPYIQIKPEEAHRLYGTNTTKDPVFMFEAGVLNFRPAATAPGTMYIRYVKGYPRLSTGSDVIAVQDRYLDLLTYTAAFILLQNDNQTARAAALKQTVTEQIQIENTNMLNSNVIEKMQQGAK